MLTLDEIVQKIQDRRTDAVAEATGVHRNIIAAIRSGRNTNPTYRTLKALSDYLTND